MKKFSIILCILLACAKRTPPAGGSGSRVIFVRPGTNAELGSSGFANEATLTVAGLTAGYNYSLYKNSSCSEPTEMITSGKVESDLVFHDLPLTDGTNQYYLQLETGDYIYCNLVFNYYKSTLTNITVTGLENKIHLEYGLDLPAKFSAQVKLDGGDPISMANSYNDLVYDIDSGSYNLTLVLTDVAGYQLTVDKPVSVIDTAQATISLEKVDNTPLSSSGLSSIGVIKANTFTNLDNIGLYQDPDCAVAIIPATPSLSPKTFTTNFAPGFNRFYIKRLSIGNSTKYSCSEMISYNRELVDVSVVAADNNRITGTANVTWPDYKLVIDGGAQESVTFPFERVETAGNHMIVVTATDNDGETQDFQFFVAVGYFAPAVAVLEKEIDVPFDWRKGVASSGILKVTNFDSGDSIGVYKDNQCKIALIEDEVVNDTIKRFNVNFYYGENSFYIKRTSGASSSDSGCAAAVTYERKKVDFFVYRDFDGHVLASVNEETFTYHLSTDGAPEQQVYFVLNLDHLSDGDHDFVLKITDRDGIIETQNHSLTTGQYSPVYVALERITDYVFTYNTGFAIAGIIRVSNLEPGDLVGVYKNAGCTESVIHEVTVARDVHRFSVNFAEGLNKFYIKKTPQGDSSQTSCSAAVTYDRLTFSVIASPGEQKITVTNTYPPYFKVDARLDNGSDRQITTPYIFNNVPTGMHTIFATVIDGDGLPLSGNINIMVSDITPPIVTLEKAGEVSLISNPGYASSLIIGVSNTEVGDILGLYKDPGCITVLVSDNTVMSLPVKIPVSVAAGTLIDGTNNFYVKKMIGANYVCSEVVTYTRGSAVLDLTPSENKLTIGFTPTVEVEDATTRIKLHNTAYESFTTSKTYYDLNNTTYTVTLELTDKDGFKREVSSDSTPVATTPVVAVLERSDTEGVLLHDKGFATSGKIYVTGFNIDEKVGVYTNDICTTPYTAESEMDENTKRFPVNFTAGNNNFYIKRTAVGNSTKYSCSSLISYYRSDLNLTVTPSEGKLSLIFNTNDDAPATFEVSLDSAPAISVTGGTHLFNGLSTGSHAVVMTATDQDGYEVTKNGNGSVLNLSKASVVLHKSEGVPFTSNPGFSTDAILYITNIENGNTVGVYKDSACLTTVEVADQVVNDSFIYIPVSGFTIGANTFYVKRLMGANESCSSAITYTRGDLNLTASGGENRLIATFTASNSIVASYNISSGALSENDVTSPYSMIDQAIGSHSITVIATDSDGKTVPKTVDATVVDITAATVSLEQTAGGAFSVNKGFATAAKLNVSGFEPNTYISVYSDNGCTTEVVAEELKSSSPVLIDVPLDIVGVNNFYVRKRVGAATICTSSPVTYTRGSISLVLSALIEAELVATFSASDSINATFTGKVDSGVVGSIASPKTYSGLIAGMHTVYITAKDEDNYETSTNESIQVTGLPGVVVTLKKDTTNNFISTSGFAGTANLNVVLTSDSLRPGEELSVYTSTDCSTGKVGSNILVDGYPKDITVPLVVGNNAFYVKRQLGASASCSPADTTYSKGALSFTLIGSEAKVTATFGSGLTDESGLIFTASLDSATPESVTPPTKIYRGLSSGVHYLRITITDADSNVVTTEKSVYVTAVTPAVVARSKKNDGTNAPVNLATGLASSFYLKVTNFESGDTLGVYSDSICNSVLVADAVYNNIPAFIPVNLVMGDNTFYVKKEIDGLFSCTSLPVTYRRGDLNLTLMPGDANIKATFGTTDSIAAAYTGYVNDAASSSAVASPHTFLGLNVGNHTVYVTATDTDGYKVIKNATIAVAAISKATAVFAKNATTDFATTTGFATSGNLKVSSFEVGTKIGVYPDASCQGTAIVNDAVKNAVPALIPVTFTNMGANTFYVKKDVSGITTCSNAITYTRGDANLTLTPGEGKITATFVATNGVNATFTGSVDGVDVGSAIISPYEFTQLAPASHTIVVTGTDADGFTVSLTQLATPSNLLKTTVALAKDDEENLFDASHIGFANHGYLLISGFSIGDSISIHKVDDCSDIATASDLNQADTSTEIRVEFELGNNVFYVKRFLGEAWSCSDEISYTRASMSLNVSSANGVVSTTFSTTPTVSGSVYEVSVDNASYSGPITSPHVIKGLPIGNHNIKVQVTDADEISINEAYVTTVGSILGPIVALKSINNTNFISNPGFATNAILEISGFEAEDEIGVYSESCGGAEIHEMTEESGSTTTRNIPFNTPGTYNLYVKRAQGENSSCAGPFTYKRILMNPITLSSYDGNITVGYSFSFDVDTSGLEWIKQSEGGNVPDNIYNDPVQLAEYRASETASYIATEIKNHIDQNVTVTVKLDSANPVTTDSPTSSHMIRGVNENNHNIVVVAKDRNNLTDTDDDSIIGSPLNMASVSFRRNSQDTPLVSNPGFATNIYVRITGHVIEDSLSVHRNASCTDQIIATTATSDTVLLQVPVTIDGANDYYIRRSYNSAVSCTSVKTYTKSIPTLDSTGIEVEILSTVSFSTGTSIKNATYHMNVVEASRIDANATFPHRFKSIYAGNYNVILTVTDGDGYQRTATDSVTVLPFTAVDTDIYKTGTPPYTVFASNPGFSTSGFVYVEKFNTGDRLELYNTNDCSGEIIQAFDNVSGQSRVFAVDFDNGDNYYSVKRIYGDTSVWSIPIEICSSSELYSLISFDNWSLNLVDNNGILEIDWEEPSGFVNDDNYHITLKGLIEDPQILITKTQTANSIQFTSTNIGHPENLVTDRYDIEIRLTADDDGKYLMIRGSKDFIASSTFREIFAAGGKSKNATIPGVTPSFANMNSAGSGMAFAALRNDGTIVTWGSPAHGGSGAPLGLYTTIAATEEAFAALNTREEIIVWGASGSGGSGAPVGDDFKDLAATSSAFAALKYEGPDNHSIITWGASDKGGGFISPPGDNYKEIIGNSSAFAALKSDGSIFSWGDELSGGIGDVPGGPYKALAGTSGAFAALDASTGAVYNWGDSMYGGDYVTPPTGSYNSIVANDFVFAVIDEFGSISVWGSSNSGGVSVSNPNAPLVSNFNAITGTTESFAALNNLDGSISMWGNPNTGGVDTNSVTTGLVFESIVATSDSFTAMRTNKSLVTWGGMNATTPGGSFKSVTGNRGAFAAIRTGAGPIATWGDFTSGGGGAPNADGFEYIVGNREAFAALKKNNGAIEYWGGRDYGGSNSVGGPVGQNYIKLASTQYAFAAIDNSGPGGTSGSITAWGTQNSGGYFNPSFSAVKFIDVVGNSEAFSGLRESGQILNWGHNNYGGTASVSGMHKAIYANFNAFAAVKSDDSIYAWGGTANQGGGGITIPANGNVNKIAHTNEAFAALRTTSTSSTIYVWGNSLQGGASGNGQTIINSDYVDVIGNQEAFTALRSTGELYSWGNPLYGGSNAPLGTGFTLIATAKDTFAAIRANGSIVAWGANADLVNNVPNATGRVFTSIIGSNDAFAALSTVGEIFAWGQVNQNSVPGDSHIVKIISPNSFFRNNSLVAFNRNGKMLFFGNSDYRSVPER